MNSNGLRLLSVLLVSSLNVVSGEQCLDFKSMPDFKIDKFYGQWYAAATTFVQTRCLEYDFYPKQVDHINEFAASTKFTVILGTLFTLTRYPSIMTFIDYKQDDHTTFTDAINKYPFTVSDTDYVSYAVVYLCHTNGTDVKHYVSILSRSEDLDKEVVERLLDNIYKTKDYPQNMTLNVVDHKKCNHENMMPMYLRSGYKFNKFYVSIKYKEKVVTAP